MRMDRRGLLCVLMMVLIYNESICISNNINRSKVCDKDEISSLENSIHIVWDTGILGVKKLTEQIKISARQTTPPRSDIVVADTPRFVDNHTGFKLENDNSVFHIQASKQPEYCNVYRQGLQQGKHISENASDLSLGISSGAEFDLSINQHALRRLRTKDSRVEITPLQFTYGFIMNDRLRRNVFGKDNRRRIESALTQFFPFSSIVRLGSGCTGTLIWYKHVLTSAHCIHDGNKFRPPLWKIKVGLLRKSGTFKWLGVKRAFVPNAWVRKAGLGKIAHDYAVLELNKPHGRPYMTFGWHPTKKGRSIQFAGFPADKPVNEIWFSYCSVQKYSRKILFNYCDATPGMSGSGVYVYDKTMYHSGSKSKKSNRKVIAIFSSFVEWRYKGGKIRRASNTATRLTSKKVERICRWMRAGEGCKLIKS